MTLITGLKSGLALLFTTAIVLSGCSISFTTMDGYSFDFEGEKAERSETESIATSVEKLSVENRFGDVIVKRSDSETKWEWTIQCWSDSGELADALTKETKLERTQNGDSVTLKLQMPEPRDDFRGSKSILTIFVKPEIEVDVANTFGIVDVADLTGQANIRNRHGDVKFVNMTGQATIENAHGNVNCSNTGALNVNIRHGDFQADGANGELVVDGEHGPVAIKNVVGNVDVKNAHGSISLNNVSGMVKSKCSHGKLSVDGVSGDFQSDLSHANLSGNFSGQSAKVTGSHSNINLVADSSELKSIEASTSHADIVVSLSPSISLKIDCDVSHGKIKSDFESSSNGETLVKISNSHGDITLRKATD